MATIEKRRERKINTSKRMALLNRQTEIQERECDNCKFKAISDPKICSGCVFAEALAEIGVELSKLSSEKARKEGEIQKQKRKPVSVTIDEYKKGVLENKSDREIAEDLGIDVISLRNWKSRRKITRAMFKQKNNRKWDFTMTKQTLNKLDILNSMEFIEIDATSEDLIYVMVANSEENISKINQIVPNVEQVVDDYHSTNEAIDITRLAFENCGATGFNGTKFTIESEGK